MASIRQIQRFDSVALQEDNSFLYRVSYVEDDGTTAIDLTVAGRRGILRIEHKDGTVLHTLNTTGLVGAAYYTDGTDGVVDFFLTSTQVAALEAGLILRMFVRYEADNASPSPVARDLAWTPLLIKKVS